MNRGQPGLTATPVSDTFSPVDSSGQGKKAPMNGQLEVTVCHRVDQRMFSEFHGAPEPAMVGVYTYTVSDDLMREDMPHDGIFRMNNAVTGQELNVTANARSLSVGDVVKTRHRHPDSWMTPTYWAVNGHGWATVEPRDALRARLRGKMTHREVRTVRLGDADALYAEVAR